MRMRYLLLPFLVLASLVLVATACTEDETPPSSSNTPTGAAVENPAQRELASAAATSTSSDANQTGLWVSGTGSVTAKPDLALLTPGIESRAKTVEEARANAANAMAAVVSALKGHNIQDRDIQTQVFSITPEYTYREILDEFERRSEQVLVGYIVTNQMAVKIRDLDDVGPIVDDVTQAGGDLTRISDISFTIEDPKPLEEQARAKAVRDAVAKAEQMAREAGVTLGRAYYLTDSTTAPMVRDFGAKAFAEGVAAALPTSISGGELEIVVTIHAAFSIR